MGMLLAKFSENPFCCFQQEDENLGLHLDIPPSHPTSLGPKGWGEGTPDSPMNKLETTVINILTHCINLAQSLPVLEKICKDSLQEGGGVGPLRPPRWDMVPI